MIESTLKFELEIEKEIRGINIVPPNLNFKITYSEPNKDDISITIPENIMKEGLDQLYSRYLNNYYNKN